MNKTKKIVFQNLFPSIYFNLKQLTLLNFHHKTLLDVNSKNCLHNEFVELQARADSILPKEETEERLQSVQGVAVSDADARSL